MFTILIYSFTIKRKTFARSLIGWLSKLSPIHLVSASMDTLGLLLWSYLMSLELQIGKSFFT
jgi:hypothetical protein